MELDPQKRSKKPNFSDSETTVLLEEIAFEYTILISKFQTSVTIAKKQKIWSAVCAAVNAVGAHGRTVQQIKKKKRERCEKRIPQPPVAV